MSRTYPIEVKTLNGVLPLSRRDILRYMQVHKETLDITALLDEALAVTVPLLSYRACFGRFPLTEKDGVLQLGFAETDSHSLKTHWQGCDEVLVFAATVGNAVDRLLAKLSTTAPARAVAADAIATAAIEAFCDHLCDEWAATIDGDLCPRFSPGYGDCPLALQVPLMGALDTAHHIGLSLTDRLLMTPQKSVTAMIGISHETR